MVRNRKEWKKDTWKQSHVEGGGGRGDNHRSRQTITTNCRGGGGEGGVRGGGLMRHLKTCKRGTCDNSGNKNHAAARAFDSLYFSEGLDFGLLAMLREEYEGCCWFQ